MCSNKMAKCLYRSWGSMMCSDSSQFHSQGRLSACLPAHVCLRVLCMYGVPRKSFCSLGSPPPEKLQALGFMSNVSPNPIIGTPYGVVLWITAAKIQVPTTRTSRYQQWCSVRSVYGLLLRTICAINTLGSGLVHQLRFGAPALPVTHRSPAVSSDLPIAGLSLSSIDIGKLIV